jgi:hypothetical protein
VVKTSSFSSKTPQWGLQPAIPWTAILGFILLSTLLILAGGGKIVNLAFPGGAFAVALLLYFKAPNLYISFTWWIWFLTPFVRRLSDYRSRFTDPSPILLAPLLVTLIASIAFFKYLPKSKSLGAVPFLLCSGSVFYGLAIGLVLNSPSAVIIAFLGWFTPIVFGFYLLLNWRDYPLYCQTIKRTFLWGVLVMGAYGIGQYLVAFEWDKFWLSNVDVVSFGLPEPLKIRVWSTMNSPQSFAGVMMAGLLLLFSNQGNLLFPAGGVGYLSFLLSMARAAWVSWVAGILVFIPSVKLQLQMRITVSIIVIALLIIPLATMEPFSTVISGRIESLSNSEDNSYQARVEGYKDSFGPALFQFVGNGFANDVTFGMGQGDSGILAMLLSLGSIATILYLGGLLTLFFRLFQGNEGRFDSFASAARAIVISCFAQIGFNVVTVSVLGMILWGFLGMGMAANKYYSRRQ